LTIDKVYVPLAPKGGKMKKIRRPAVLMAVTAFLAAGILVSCKPKATLKGMESGKAPQNFSADLVMTTNAGTFEGKAFVGENMTRMEMPESTVISRMDKNLVWILMPTEKMYIEHPMNPENSIFQSSKLPGETERTLVTSEVINGKKTEKYKITYSVDGKSAAVFQWIEPSSGIPIKSASLDGTWTYEYRNVQPGKQNLALFELPSDYKKYSMPGMKK
jgi:hypothetical protein